MPDEATLAGVNLTPAILGALEPPALIARSHDGRSGQSAMSVALASREPFFRLASGRDRGRDGRFPIEVYARSGAGEQAEPSNLADPQNPLHRRMLIELEAYRSVLSADPGGGGVPSAAGE